MSILVSEIFHSITDQQLPALQGFLQKAQAHLSELGISEEELLQTRLFEDMHPLIWQVQTVAELGIRSAFRLTRQDPPSLDYEGLEITELVDRLKQNIDQIRAVDKQALDQSIDQQFELPIGPDTTLTMTGKDYVLKFFLPNFYFHLTTAYDLLRMKGVPVGKRDFLGAV